MHQLTDTPFGRTITYAIQPVECVHKTAVHCVQRSAPPIALNVQRHWQPPQRHAVSCDNGGSSARAKYADTRQQQIVIDDRLGVAYSAHAMHQFMVSGFCEYIHFVVFCARISQACGRLNKHPSTSDSVAASWPACVSATAAA
jgi:hypothetical protein